MIRRPLRKQLTAPRFLILSLLLWSVRYAGALDLSQAHIEKLGNGLTVMVLEDHTMPLVSTQALYKVGGRNECQGSTGLAHFVEHMAFRATRNFPDTDVVSRIYAVGGEWHGYTWIDETTYFETVPVRYLDLVLQIQADRMASIVNSPDEIEAERGAVITELHSYENDPASLLFDNVLATSFLQHSYRYNTIGWISDVRQITHDDIAGFYHRYYKPSNAVLAIAGDVRLADVMDRVRRCFGAIPGGDPIVPPFTVEPPQNGERRLVLRGRGAHNYFQIAYHAPAAKDPDYPVFLVLQGLLTGSAGVNFEQKEEGVEAQEGSRLYGIADGIASFFQPTADPYSMDLTGRADTSTAPSEIESSIEAQLAKLREQPAGADELEAVKKDVLREIVFDVETTENAAHQMAFFEGIGAFDVLRKLPDLVNAVTARDVQRVAAKYLQPYQRTIGWYMTDGKAAASLVAPAAGRAQTKHTASPEAGPKWKILKNGAAVIVQRIVRTPTAYLRILLQTNNIEASEGAVVDDPVAGYTSVNFRFLREDLAGTVQKAAAMWKKGFAAAQPDPSSAGDPEERLEAEIRDVVGLAKRTGPPNPAVIALSGDVDEQEALRLLEQNFGKLPGPATPSPGTLRLKETARTVRLPGKPQSQLGYVAPAAAPSSRNWTAWRILLYILSHGYEGRLGKDLIARKGLIYYIDSNYRTDGKNGWITMTAGVDPDKLEATRQRFHEILNDLRENPPTEAEVAEGKQYLMGRRLTGYQSNEELTDRYAVEWIEFGRLQPQSAFEDRVNGVSLQDVRALVPAFLSGATIVVDTSD